MAAYTTIDDPTLHFQVLTYTGDGESTRALTLPGDTDMAPDLVWIKQRNTTRNHQVNDRVRGTSKVLLADLADAEDATGGTVKAYGTDGFSVNDSANANEDSGTYVAWCWKANGTGSANTAGSINTAATSANTTSGVSINTYEGTGSATTVGHGLGAVPEIIIIRSRDTASVDWAFFHGILGGTKYLLFNTAGAAGTASSLWNDTDPTSTVFTIGTTSKVNTDDENYVAYVFTSKQGFSKFGSFIGNGNANGPFIYTGFRPAFVILKTSSRAGTDDWRLYDNKRLGYNVDNNSLMPNTTAVPRTDDDIDLLSNGFKLRNTPNDVNPAGETAVYMAFAEAPFVNSEGVPNNAR